MLIRCSKTKDLKQTRRSIKTGLIGHLFCNILLGLLCLEKRGLIICRGYSFYTFFVGALSHLYLYGYGFYSCVGTVVHPYRTRQSSFVFFLVTTSLNDETLAWYGKERPRPLHRNVKDVFDAFFLFLKELQCIQIRERLSSEISVKLL